MNRLIALLLGLAFSAQAYCAPLGANEELKSMIVMDQQDRTAKKIDWKAVGQRDKERADRVGQMLSDGAIKTAEDYYNAAMIFHHAGDGEEIKLAFALATLSAKLAPEHPAPKWLAAAAWDRYMMWKNLPQWYGTQSQVSQQTGEQTLYPIHPSAISDEERKAANVPVLAK